MGVTCNQFGGNKISVSKALNTNVYGNGSGQALVLAHGFGSDQTSWHFLIPYLVCYFKVVVFDMVFVNPELYDEKRYSGSFDGYAEDLVCLLDELNIRDSIYVGHSMSAMIGGIASIKRPHLFKQLVLYSGSPRYLNDASYNGGFDMKGINETIIAMKEDYPSWVKSFAPSAVMKKGKAIAEFERSLLRMKSSVAMSVAETIFTSDYRSILAQISVKSLIIQSRKDVIVPKSVSFYMKRNLGGHACVEILNTKGHFPHLSAYRLLLRALLRGLKINQ